MTYGTSQPPAGWYPDPQSGSQQRWWNGVAWTATTRPAAAAAPPAFAPSGSSGYTPAFATPGQPPAASGYPQAPSQPGSVPSYPMQPHPGAGVPQGGAVQPYAHPVAYATLPTGAWRSPADDRPAVFGMGGALRVVLSKYAVFTGRASRSEFWYWVLFNAILGAGVIVLFLLGSALPPLLMLGGIAYFALILWTIGVWIPELAVTIRRLRDAGYHWAFIFLCLVPFGGLAVLIMCCQPSRYP